jgi:hypothetical protein
LPYLISSHWSTPSPSNWLARAFPKKSYRYLYAVTDALHARDNAYEFPYIYNTLSPYSPTLYTSFIGAITSFVRSSPPSPNALFSDRAQLEAEGGDWPAFFDDGKKKHGGGEVAWKTLNVSALTNSSTSYVERGVPRVGLGSEERCAFWAKVRVEGGWWSVIWRPKEELISVHISACSNLYQMELYCPSSF